jgi:prepilin-type N-terminal cleavage/methylation domain-containing protein
MQLTRRPDDRGVTLIEVLIAIAILGVIIVPLGVALVTFLRNSGATTNRLAESHDEQIASAYFAQDVESIGVRDWTTAPYALKTSVEQNAPPTTGLYPCGAASTPNAVLRFAWDDPTSTTATRVIVVSYVVKTVGGEQQLHRLRCEAGSTTPTSDIVLAHNVFGVGTPVLTGTGTVPQAVSLTINIKAPTDSGAALSVVLSGQRRQT